MKRRSFFKKLAQSVAMVALAPRLAGFEFVRGSHGYPYRNTGIYEMLQQCGDLTSYEPLNLDEMMSLCYKMKREREESGRDKIIEFYFQI